VAIFLINILSVVFLIFIIRFFLKKYNFLKKIQILEFNPELKTDDHDQHIRRLNKFRKSNYKGVVYYFSKKGGLYYYSKNNVRIYI
tara:strand:- start:149 stop:406 length:258 start_codon:yes stop_codon:yes gene_type:complete